jgi:acyl-CoA thioesterase-1
MVSTRKGLLVPVSVFLTLFLCTSVDAEDKNSRKTKESASPKKKVFQSVPENPHLPRVLLLGDSISIGYTFDVRERFEGEANVQRAPTNCGPTSRGLEHLETWLGDKPWDVIHFNFGLHDLKYIDKKGRLVAVENGTQQIPVAQYEENLRKLIARLKKTDAVLIFATTTPVPEGAKGRIPGDEVEYNRIAKKLAREHGIMINDLYFFAEERLDDIQLPANVHFSPEGSRALSEKVACHIRMGLKKKKESQKRTETKKCLECFRVPLVGKLLRIPFLGKIGKKYPRKAQGSPCQFHLFLE